MVAEAGPDRRLAGAYATCARIARRHHENFPVASLVLPRGMRPHVAALYAFARTADDFADEGERTAGDRLALLDWWLGALRDTAADAGGARGDAAVLGSGPRLSAGAPPDIGEARHVFAAVGATIRRFDLPVPLLEDLLSAFRQDVVVNRYESRDRLLDYCRRSANPVGRLVLRIAGRAGDPLDLASDAVCTALQLANFWQDLARDWRKGRLYVPLDVLARHGGKPEDLDQGRLTSSWLGAIGEMAAWTRSFFERGQPVAGAVGGRLGLELRLTWLGGVAVLDKVAAPGFDPFARRPSLGAWEVIRLLGRALRWPASLNR